MRKYVKIQTVFQREEVEVGAACLAMIFGYFGKIFSLEQLRAEVNTIEDGLEYVSAANIMRTAKRYGLDCHGYRKEPEQLKELTPPCIIHWNFNHFVVFEGVKGKYAYINDSKLGERKLSWEELGNSFTGVVLTFSKTEAFQPDMKNNLFSKLTKIWGN